jgi:putative tryptophan/tyrosine transport system substrate-binding protein
MKRREFIGLLAGTAALRPPKVRAQQPAGKVIRIGYLGVASASEGARGAKAFETGLRDLGYLEGKSLVIEYRWANGRHEQVDVLATELVRVPVDVIVAPTTAAALAARNATATIPIVFATVSAPVELARSIHESTVVLNV